MADLRVLDVRLSMLEDAIRDRDWAQVEWEFDRVRSTLSREMGTRDRPVDLLRCSPGPPFLPAIEGAMD